MATVSRNENVHPWIPWVFITLVIAALLGWSGIIIAFVKVVAKLFCVFGVT
jgi:hypothetical protein